MRFICSSVKVSSKRTYLVEDRLCINTVIFCCQKRSDVRAQIHTKIPVSAYDDLQGSCTDLYGFVHTQRLVTIFQCIPEDMPMMSHDT